MLRVPEYIGQLSDISNPRARVEHSFFFFPESLGGLGVLQSVAWIRRSHSRCQDDFAPSKATYL